MRNIFKYFFCLFFLFTDLGLHAQSESKLVCNYLGISTIDLGARRDSLASCKCYTTVEKLSIKSQFYPIKVMYQFFSSKSPDKPGTDSDAFKPSATYFNVDSLNRIASIVVSGSNAAFLDHYAHKFDSLFSKSLNCKMKTGRIGTMEYKVWEPSSFAVMIIKKEGKNLIIIFNGGVKSFYSFEYPYSDYKQNG